MLRLEAAEFTYIGVQRVKCTLHGQDVSGAVAELLNAYLDGPDIPQVRAVGGELLVESGESFGLDDFAAVVAEVIACSIVAIDGGEVVLQVGTERS